MLDELPLSVFRLIFLKRQQIFTKTSEILLYNNKNMLKSTKDRDILHVRNAIFQFIISAAVPTGGETPFCAVGHNYRIINIFIDSLGGSRHH